MKFGFSRSTLPLPVGRSCDGQILPINQFTAVFSLLGTNYGGDGHSNFALPNMQGNAPMHPGQGPGLSLYDLGESSGSDTVTLIDSEMPQHTHTLNAHNNVPPSNAGTPGPSVALESRSSGGTAYTVPASLVTMSQSSVTPAGGSQPHNNLMPYLTLNFCIALQGVFPPRNAEGEY